MNTQELEIGSPEEIEINERFEALRLEPTETYTLPEIAQKLETNKELNKIERYMAAGVIRNHLKIVGRPKKYKTEEERLAAKREQNVKANEARRIKRFNNSDKCRKKVKKYYWTLRRQVTEVLLKLNFTKAGGLVFTILSQSLGCRYLKRLRINQRAGSVGG